jgi:putative salt-induced outer membrane protein YdiY
MNYTLISARSLAALFITAFAALGYADTVDTKNGAHLVGTITEIDAGSMTLKTDFAGKITIKQSEVTSFTTDQPIAIRLASGTRFDGRVAAGTGGAIQIAGSDGTITTRVDKVTASWAAGKTDPSLERHWSYEASVDIAGKTGNKEQLGTAAQWRATLKTMQDTLQFYANYDRQISDGAKSADQFKAGVDYQNNFAGRNSWYVKDEGGFDRVKKIDLYNIAAAGYGFDVVHKPAQTLTGRAGLSFRYESYTPPPVTPSLKDAGLDFELNNEMTFTSSKLVNRLAYVPSFNDFANYRITHESFFEMPLANPAWKLRIGVSNDYNSKPPKGIERLDTAYFTRLVLLWE